MKEEVVKVTHFGGITLFTELLTLSIDFALRNQQVRPDGQLMGIFTSTETVVGR